MTSTAPRHPPPAPRHRRRYRARVSAWASAASSIRRSCRRWWRRCISAPAKPGLIASANFAGYLIGALVAAASFFAPRRRGWMLGALLVSALTTGAMAASASLFAFLLLRFLGGFASAFALVFTSSLVLDRLSEAGRGHMAGHHFAGVGAGIALSAVLVATRGPSCSVAVAMAGLRRALGSRIGGCRDSRPAPTTQHGLQRQRQRRHARRRARGPDRGLWSVRLRLRHHRDLPGPARADQPGDHAARALCLADRRPRRGALGRDLALVGRRCGAAEAYAIASAVLAVGVLASVLWIAAPARSWPRSCWAAPSWASPPLAWSARAGSQPARPTHHRPDDGVVRPRPDRRPRSSPAGCTT